MWDLKYIDNYYWINDKGAICASDWLNKEIDIARRAIGNCFLSLEEAEFEVERRKVETILLKYGRREFNQFPDGIKEKGNYMIISNLDIIGNIGKIMIDNSSRYPISNMIYFDTYELCKKAMDEIGEDKIRKYLLRREKYTY